MTDVADLMAAIEARKDVLEPLGYRVRFDITEGGSILVDATGPEVRVSEARAEADTVLTLKADNLKKLIDGKLNPMIAFSTGRLKVKGSQGVALKLAGLLED